MNVVNNVGMNTVNWLSTDCPSFALMVAEAVIEGKSCSKVVVGKPIAGSNVLKGQSLWILLFITLLSLSHRHPTR